MFIKKAQVAMEFMIFMGLVLFLLLMVLVSVNNHIANKINERKDLQVKNIAIIIRDEINLAHKSIDGYKREFSIPSDINGEDYIVGFADDFVFVRTIDERHAISLPILNLTGVINKGVNVIVKQNGGVKLNE
jgi:hypothetical protein